jgi:hypothetical protein
MKKWGLVLWFSVFLLAGCGSSGTVRANTFPSGGSSTQNTSLPDDKDFIGEGSAPDFPDARNKAYVDVVKKALLYVIGENNYNKNKPAIDDNLMNYLSARKFILGETEKAGPGKEKKWVANSRDSSGNLNLKLQAYVSLKKLKDYADTQGWMSQPAITTAQSSSQPTDNLISGTSSSASSQAQQDLSGVDVSSLTFLAFYNPKDPSIKNDPDQATYAKWAVDNLNRELSSLNIQTFDLEAMDKLASERNLLQESTSGTVGVGLLLAQKVYAELYAEVVPSVTYEGSKAHVIVNIKVYVRTTGALIASIEKGGQQYESVSAAAAIKMSMKEAVKKAMVDITLGLKKYVNNGRFFFVRLSGVQSYKDASKFSTTVGKLDGVVGITLKSGSKQDMVYDYNLQFKGNPTDAVDRLFASMQDKVGFEKFDLKEIRGNELIFTLE